jgi:hypothetical protein
MEVTVHFAGLILSPLVIYVMSYIVISEVIADLVGDAAQRSTVWDRILRLGMIRALFWTALIASGELLVYLWFPMANVLWKPLGWICLLLAFPLGFILWLDLVGRRNMHHN